MRRLTDPMLAYLGGYSDGEAHGIETAIAVVQAVIIEGDLVDSLLHHELNAALGALKGGPA